MANTDAVNVDGDLTFEYDNWTVLLSQDSNPPARASDSTEEIEGQGEPDETTINALSVGLNAIEITQAAGGQTLDDCQLEWALTGYLTDRTQPESFSRMLAVLLPEPSAVQIFLGDYVAESESVSPEGEKLSARAQMRPYHFGSTFEGQLQLNPLDGSTVTTHHPPVFNPVIDGRVLGNRSDETNSDGAYIWIHPEAALTELAKTYAGQEVSQWTLRNAVETMCTMLNAETIIANPSSDELDKLIGAASLQNVRLEMGQYLPYYLDLLLQPLGRNWFIDYEVDEGEKPKIAFFTKGVGTAKQLYFQAPGEALDLDLSNVNQYELSRTIGDQPNQYRVWGDWERAEVTLPLWPAWATSSDSLTAESLNKETGSSYEGNEEVHRKWVANMAGDITGLRSDSQAAGDPPDLTDVFTKYVPRRRTADDPLSYMGDADGLHRRPLLVEYSTDSGTTWAEIPDSIAAGMLRLPDEVGILFDGTEPPSDLVDASTAARLRMTCTIEGDSRINSTASRQASAVNGRVHEEVLDRSDKFQKRWVETDGTYASQLASSSSGADEKDDSDEIAEFAENLRDLYEVAELDCSFVLPGFHLEYKIGDIIDRIEGREVSLNQASESGTARYVQVTQRKFRMTNDGPVTILIVDRGVRDV